MKLLLILLSNILSIIFSRESCDDIIKVTQRNNCTNYQLTDYEKLFATNCCYITYKDPSGTEHKNCKAFVKKGVTKENVEKYGNNCNICKDYSIDCRSNWIQIKFIFILFAFLYLDS